MVALARQANLFQTKKTSLTKENCKYWPQHRKRLFVQPFSAGKPNLLCSTKSRKDKKWAEDYNKRFDIRNKITDDYQLQDVLLQWICCKIANGKDGLLF